MNMFFPLVVSNYKVQWSGMVRMYGAPFRESLAKHCLVPWLPFEYHNNYTVEPPCNGMECYCLPGEVCVSVNSCGMVRGVCCSCLKLKKQTS